MKCTELSHIKKPSCLPDAQATDAPGLNAFSMSPVLFLEASGSRLPLKAGNRRRFSAHTGVVAVGSMAESPFKQEGF